MRDYVKKWLTEKGIEALKNRLKSYVDMYNTAPEKEYPLNIQMFGFPVIEIKNPDEFLGRMKELAELTDMQFEVKR